MDRREELLTAIDTLLSAHAQWQETDNPEISPELVQRIEDAITVWSGGDMPGDLLPAYAKMQALNEAWTAAVMDADDPDHIQTNRAGKFWKSLDAIRQLRQRAEEEDNAEERPLESVAMLTGQKVSDQQICWIYRSPWPDGAKSGPGLWDWVKKRPLLHLLEREREKPGSVIRGDFVPFYVTQRKEAAAKRKTAADRSAAARQQRIEKITKPCAESLADLVKQGVSLTQIARMKKTTKASVRKQCVAAGLAVPAEEYEAARSEFQPELNESQQRIDQAERPAVQKSEVRSQKSGDVSEADLPAEPGAGDDDFGGPIDGAIDEPITAHEQLVARWMESGATAAGEIAKGIKTEGGPELRAGDVKAIMGRLKGDPERLQAALAQ